jgi:hypothetical protein
MAKKKKAEIKTLKDKRLPAVIQAAYNLGVFDGRNEIIDSVRREVSVAKTGLFAVAEECKHMDLIDKGKISIYIEEACAKAALAAFRKSRVKSYKQYVPLLKRKLQKAKGEILERKKE